MQGTYITNFLGPAPQGGNVFRTSVTAFVQQENGVEERSVFGGGVEFVVPEGAAAVS